MTKKKYRNVRSNFKTKWNYENAEEIGGGVGLSLQFTVAVVSRSGQ